MSKTHIVFLLDSSGSMSSIKDDTIGSFNEFLKSQKALPEKATFTFALFNNYVKFEQTNIDLQLVEELNDSTFIPSGATALLDAIGEAVAETDKYLNELKATPHDTNLADYLEEKELPDRILFAILTDGFENSSKEYDKDQIADIITKKEKQTDIKWDFVYLGANQDAIQEAGKYGFAKGKSLTYAATGAGIDNTMTMFARKITNLRATGASPEGFSFSEEERKEAISE